ncbi:MAG: sensor histidine kinase [Thiobacillus sp.]
MKFDGTDLYAALIHELKNNLGLLAMTLESIPLQGESGHDGAVDASRLLCQGVVDRLHQALRVYKAADQQIHPAIDAYSPHDLVHAVRDRTIALCRGRLHVETQLDPDLPAIWFFDRDLIEMALINGIHNALAHAASTLRIEASMREGCLALIVRDDSAGYPAHILASMATDGPYPTTGTGLGLRFSRLIAQSHDNKGRSGELRLCNDPGAVFCLMLP